MAGTIVSRSASSAWFDVASVPDPSTGIDTTATVRAGLMSTVTGSCMSPVSSARRRSCSTAAVTAGAATSAALITTVAGTSVPGNACCRRL